MLIKPTEQSWLSLPQGFLGILGEVADPVELVRPGALTGTTLTCGRQAALGPALGVKVHAVPGSDQVPAQIGDVSLGASSRRINPLKVQGQVHGFQSPRSYPEPGVPRRVGIAHRSRAEDRRAMPARPTRQSHSTISSYRSSKRFSHRVSRDARRLPLTRLAVVLQITRRPEPDHPRMPARPADSDPSAVNPPESQAVAVGDAVDAVG